MIKPKLFFEFLSSLDINFFTGVPDSTLKEFCFCIDDNIKSENHIITANEGNSVALATGYNLATGSLPLVYMQNSGFGNAINPLLSLSDPEVYSIPMIVLMGWRGEPGTKDEPQHKMQGKVQIKLLEALEIPYHVLSKARLEKEKVRKIIDTARMESRPCVLLVRKGTFQKYKKSYAEEYNNNILSREGALEIIISQLEKGDIVVSTTGKLSREIFEIRERKLQTHEKDFLTVGSMGHCSSIALGIAIQKPERNVYCIDGDGSLIMHAGSLATIGKINPNNLTHIIINNFSYESVGGQSTASKFIDIPILGKANSYKHSINVKDSLELEKGLADYKDKKGPKLLVVETNISTRKDLGRPTRSPLENKKDFVNFLK